MERRVGTTEARKYLARIVEGAEHRGENWVILRHGQPAAAVVPMDVYHRWVHERGSLFEAVRKAQAANEYADPDEVMADVLSAQRAVRASRPE